MTQNAFPDFRNARHTDGNRIDCEINDPEYGWIPITLDQDEHADLIAHVRTTGPVAAKVIPPVTPQAVKDEARRRILAIAPEWKQHNLTAEATALAEKGRDTWSADELAAWNNTQTIRRQINDIRQASNRIEALNPIPSDFEDDKHWP